MLKSKEFICKKLNCKDMKENKKLEIFIEKVEQSKIPNSNKIYRQFFEALTVIFYSITVIDSKGTYIFYKDRNKIVYSPDMIIFEDTLKIEINTDEYIFINHIDSLSEILQDMLVKLNQEMILVIYDNISYSVFIKDNKNNG